MDQMLSQEEINALLGSIGGDEEEEAAHEEEYLTSEEKDAIGEISNISMGTAATTLSTLLNQRVNITTPNVSLANWDDISNSYTRPCVFIHISYIEGLDGNNVLILREDDVKIITDLMMGGDGTVSEDSELSELHLSAIGEAMNQMMGSASTSLSSMLEKKVDISPPVASLIDLNDTISSENLGPFLQGTFIRVSFRLEIGTLLDSELMQLYPVDFAKDLYNKFIESTEANAAPPQPEPTQPAPSAPMPGAADMGGMAGAGMGMPGADMSGMNQMGAMMQPGMPQMSAGMMQPNPAAQQMGMPGYGMQMPGTNMAGMGMPQMGMPQQNFNVAPAQFQSFATNISPLAQQENIDLIMDVPLEVTVELGRTNKSIKEILDFSPGTIIELNKLAGEAIDVLVNGKFVAKGEVVVIEDSFGIRITEIVR